MHTLQGIVFDYGGVISAPQDPTFFSVTRRLLGLDREAILVGWARYRSELDRGTRSPEELYRLIARDHGLSPTPETLAEIARADYDSWAHGNLETLRWARELKAQGFKIGILTNMPPDYEPWFDRAAADFRALADAELISGQVHLVKPEPAIYAMMAERMALPPEALCFLDDTERNVVAARACGWQAIHFTTVAAAREALGKMTEAR